MFIEQMGSLLDDDEHCDVTFFVGPSKTEVRVMIARHRKLRLAKPTKLLCFDSA